MLIPMANKSSFTIMINFESSNLLITDLPIIEKTKTLAHIISIGLIYKEKSKSSKNINIGIFKACNPIPIALLHAICSSFITPLSSSQTETIGPVDPTKSPSAPHRIPSVEIFFMAIFLSDLPIETEEYVINNPIIINKKLGLIE